MALSFKLSPAPIRDPKYYFPDGNTVVLVENTLFKIHRFQLIQDHSAFEGMFSCPTVASTEGLEGESDDNPIRLQGDSVEEMRALMGYLYSLPHEMQTDLTNNVAFYKRCRLARIAHKYHFESIEKWALDAIKAFWMSRDEPSQMSIFRLRETTNVASLCQNADLIGIVTVAWMKIVKAGNISNIKFAIQIAEQHGLSSVKGPAYYVIMVLGRDVWETDATITTSQRLKLLSGFHDCAQMWNRFEKQELPDITHSACTLTNQTSPPSSSVTPSRCKLGWVHLWKTIFTHPVVRDVLVSRSPADVIGKLSFIANMLKPLHQEMFESTGRKMAAGCLKSASAMIKALSEAISGKLPDIFVDPK